MARISEKINERLLKIQVIFAFRDFMLLWLRVWVAKIFYDSGRTKSGEGFLEINDFQGTLFEEEYGISFMDTELLAQITLYAETILPLAILLGLGSRLGALGLLAMTLFIQVFVYPMHFFEHISWAVALIMIIVFGAGKISLEAIFRKTN